MARLSFALPITLTLCLWACSEKTPQAPAKPALPSNEPAQGSSKKALRFGVLPSQDPAALKKEYQPMLDQMAALLEQPVELSVAKDYNALLDTMIQGTIDFGQMSAYVYIKGATKRLRAGVKTNVLAQARAASETPYHGVIVVPKRSKLRSPKQLQGKKIAFVDEASSSGFYYPRMKLRDMGLDPDTLFNETVFAGSHGKVLKLVRSGEVDAGAVSSIAIIEDGEGLHTLLETDPIPDDAIVSLGKLEPSAEQALSKLLLEAHENESLKPFLQARGIARYVAADVNAYLPQTEEMKRSDGDSSTPSSESTTKR